MNVQEFEQALGNRIVKPISNLQLQAFFQKQYTPEDIIKIMTTGSNTAYSVDKEQAGAGLWKYSVNTLSSGYIFCKVHEQTTGGNMGEIDWLKTVESVLDSHTTTRKFIKGAVIFGVTFFVSNQTELLKNLPDWGVIFAGAVITALSSWLQTKSTLPILGAADTKAK